MRPRRRESLSPCGNRCRPAASSSCDARQHRASDTNDVSPRRDAAPIGMEQALRPRDLLLTLAVVTLLGVTFVPIKVGLRELPPFALAALRFFFAAVPLVLVIRRSRMPWPDVVGSGLALGVFQFGLLFLGIKLGMPAGLSSLIIQVQVFFTIGLAVLFAGDRLHRHTLVGAAIAAIGMAALAAYKLASGLTGTF